MNIAGVPGLEPRQAEPESAGLPITPYPNYPKLPDLLRPEEKDNLKFERKITSESQGGLNPIQALGCPEKLHRLKERR